MPTDPKPARRRGNRPRRIINPKAIWKAKLNWPNCAACGVWAMNGSGHHVLPKDKFGDDVEANIIVLCGSGTSKCHGAHHGNPYTVEVALPLGSDRPTSLERRTAEWVNHRVGLHLIEERPDVIGYVVGKLGEREASATLERLYAIRLDDDGVWRQAPAAAPVLPPGFVAVSDPRFDNIGG